MNPYESPKASLDRPKTPMERDIEEGAKQFYAEVRALFMMGVIMALHVTTIMDVQRLAFPLANIAVVAAVLGAVATSIAIVFQICRMILVLWIDDLPWKLDLFLWGVFERVKKAVTFFTIIVAVATAHEIVVGLGGGLVHLFLSACGVCFSATMRSRLHWMTGNEPFVAKTPGPAGATSPSGVLILLPVLATMGVRAGARDHVQ